MYIATCYADYGDVEPLAYAAAMDAEKMALTMERWADELRAVTFTMVADDVEPKVEDWYPVPFFDFR